MTTHRRWIVLLLSCLLAWFFWNSILLAPLRVLVVVFHEAGHALAALLTGGSVVSITVGPNEGGRTMTMGGWRFLILNGGYLGSLATGLALLGLVRKPGRGRLVLGGLAVLLWGAALLWFRPVFSFGFAYALAAGLGLGLLAAKGPEPMLETLARFLGVFSVLYALFDIRDDVFRGGLFGGSWYAGPTDAHSLAELTLIPAPLWGVAWIGAGLGALWAIRRWWT